MPDMFHQKDVQGLELATEMFQEPEVPEVESGASAAVAGRGWLDKIAVELEKYGLRPITVEVSQKFKGLGGARREKFRINVENVEPEVFLVAETLQVSMPDFRVKGDADRWVQGAFKRIDKLMKEFAVIFDVLRDNNETFLWELFAKEARFTHVASKGGRANATPPDLSVGVNFNDPRTRSDFLFAISRARREVPIVDLLSWRGNKPPLYEAVTLRQCMHGLVDNYGDPIRKPTCTMVPNGSCFPGLERRCDGSHQRADMVGRGPALAPAGAWPNDLGKALAGAGAHELARRTSPKEMGIGRGATRSPSKQIVNAVARGALADCSDARAGDPGFAAINLVKRFPTDAVIAVYVAEPKVQTPFPATVRVYGSKPKTFESDNREADTAHRDLQHEGESFGDKPSDITAAQWGALKKLHINLSHSSARALKGRLKSYEACQQVLGSVDKLDCGVCKELGRPTTVRSSNLKLSTEFNENVFLDEAEVILADGTRLMVMVILDDASGFRTIIPTAAVRSITGEVLYYDAAKGHITKRFAEIGEKCTILVRPVPAEAPQLRGRVERAIDLFKDHLQRLDRDMQLAKNDDPHVWTSVIASTRNNHTRRNGFTPYQCALGRSPGTPASLIEAMEGDQRQLAWQRAALFEEGPRRAEQIRAAANSAFFELDSDDAVRRAMVGRARPPRGPFVPGQLVFYWLEVKHVKSKRLQGEHGWRGPAIALATEGRARLHLSYRGAPVLAAPEQARHACRSEAETVENEDLVRQLSHWRGGPTSQKGLIDERGPGPYGSDKTGARRERDEKGSDHEDGVIDTRRTHLHLDTYLEYHHYREEDRFLHNKLQTHLLRQLGRGTPWTWTRRLLQAFRINSNSNQIELSNQNLHHDSASSERFPTTRRQIANAYDCDARLSRAEWKAAFEASDLEEWRKWVEYDAVDWPTGEELAGVDKTAILPMRRSRTDKRKATRGSPSYEQHPLKAKSRNIVPGCKDKQLLAGELQTNAPALTDTATAVILQEAASQSGWRLEQGDVDSAFLNRKYLDSSRRVHFRAPKGGLPAVPEMGWPSVPEGAVLRAKKGIYGLCLWYEEHRDAMLSLPGASRSKLRPALFIFHDENEKLMGLIGTHVDDDVVAGSPEFFANQETNLRKMHCCGTWQTAKTAFHHCGRSLKQSNDGTITCSQREYTESIEKIPISNERRKDKEAKATPEEGDAPQRQPPDSVASAIYPHAKTDHVDITFQKINIDDAIVVAVGDSSHGNVGKTETASLAGLVILLADNKDDQLLRGRLAKVTPMLRRSHRIKRVVRSTLAAEAMAAQEAVESGDMLRQHLVEMHYGLGYRTHMDDVKAIKMVEVTDCKSLYDLLQKRGTVPSEKWLLINIESLRNDLEFNNAVSKWVSTKQMLADCLTKHDVRAGDYRRCVLQTGEYRMELKGRRGGYYRSKYPKRQRPADQLFVHEGYTYFEDWHCGVEDMVGWSGLDQVTKRRRIPTQVRKLSTIYAPTKAALERYEKDFTEKHTIKKPKVTNDEDPQKELGVTEEFGAHVESDENVKLAATVTVCALCRMTLNQCECGPRTGHSSREKIAGEFGDAIEGGVLEAHELAVKNCDECRRGK
ncbi:unnamed protein product [Prorocentrum cordatum]|uniref:Copia protein n=1 Tax=Prorocentrum cordatum TaxID=2364126 RepID=A0ABN9TD91_9DINO|nr:unnamed protein product [Polarella glacialis]